MNNVKIKTVSPFNVPLVVKLGVDQSSQSYLKALNALTQQNSSFTGVQTQNGEQDYDKIDNDARDVRILLWQHVNWPNLKIHLFPNGIAIAECDLVIEVTLGALSACDIAANSQETTKVILKQAYSQFIEDLATIGLNSEQSIFNYNCDEEAFKVHWISRFLLLEKQDLANSDKAILLTQWLKDTQHPEEADAILRGVQDYSMTWLHYAIVDLDTTQPDHRVETMVLAQYYYTAQENCNKLLKQAIDSAYNSNDRVKTEKKLSYARVVTRLHQIDFHEHKKFLNRYKRRLLDDILLSWDFADVSENGQRMIEICSARLEEADNKRRERSTVMTDLLLVTLSFFAVFELSLYLTEFSREMMSRPALDYNDESKSIFLQYIAEIDVDVMFSFGFGLTLALIIVYRLMKGK